MTQVPPSMAENEAGGLQQTAPRGGRGMTRHVRLLQREDEVESNRFRRYKRGSLKRKRSDISGPSFAGATGFSFGTQCAHGVRSGWRFIVNPASDLRVR